ncbi:MAG: hypothetical protein N2C14_19985, partial [Planctomycetales bacterium]
MNLRRWLAYWATLTGFLMLFGCGGCGCGGGSGGKKTLSIAKRLERASRPSDFLAIAKDQLAGGDTPGAEETLTKAVTSCEIINDPAEKAELYAKCAEMQHETGLRKPARETLKKAVEAAKKIEDVDVKARRLGAIGRAQANTKEFDVAAATLKEAEAL